MGFAYFLLIAAVPLALWGMINPRSQWRVLQSWRYRRPEMNEPSEAAYGFTRVASGILLVLIVAVGVIIIQADTDRSEPPPLGNTSVCDYDPSC